MIVQPKLLRYNKAMNKNLVLKLMFLIFGLVMVLWFRQQMGSQTVTQTLSAMFGSTPDKNSFNWCADHVVDLTWMDKQIPSELQAIEMSDLRDRYCRLPIEPINNLDIDKVEWRPLADSSGAAGQRTSLLWNPELKVFKSGGMPFKSSKFALELVPAAQ